LESLKDVPLLLIGAAMFVVGGRWTTNLEKLFTQYGFLGEGYQKKTLRGLLRQHGG